MNHKVMSVISVFRVKFTFEFISLAMIFFVETHELKKKTSTPSVSEEFYQCASQRAMRAKGRAMRAMAASHAGQEASHASHGCKPCESACESHSY